MLIAPMTEVGTLGTVVMIEMREAINLPHQTLLDKWIDLGLDPRHCPKPRNRRDAFRLATPRGKWKDGLALIEYKGPAKAAKDNQMSCVLTRSTDAKSRIALTHKNRATVALSKDDQIVVERPGGLTKNEEAYLDEVVTNFIRYQTVIDGSLVRGGINRVLREINAVWFRDGVNMIPRTHEETARALAELVRWLDGYSPTPNTIFTFGYGDTPEQREQLRETIQAHVTRDLRQKLAEIDAKDKIGNRYRNGVTGDLLQLAAMIAEFEEVLGEGLRDVRSAYDMYETLIQRQLA